jgi:hypothetical protein
MVAIAVALSAGCEQLLDIQPVPVPDGSLLDAAAEAMNETSTDAPPSTCGAFGQPCCDGGGCSTGQCLSMEAGARCVAFAGAYEKASTTTCGVVQGCVNGNAATSSCACPFGWAPQSAPFDVACNDSVSAPSHLDGELNLCGISTMPTGTDWAGAFLAADIPSCEPSTDAGCMMANAITGACSCPGNDASVEAVQLRVFVPGYLDAGCQNGALGGALTVCLPRNTQPTTLVGVFEKDGLGVCRVHSASLTGCSCPTGTTPSIVRSIQESPQGCTNNCTSYPETTITFCMAL